MPWLTRPPATSERDNQRRSYRQSIEQPIAFSVRGLPAPVYGTLINISETGCRLRSLILLDRGRTVEFELNRPGVPALALCARVVGRSTPQSGAGYEYGLAFDEISPRQRDLLAREVAELQRRAAAARAQARDAAARGASGGQRRRSVRALITFPVRFRPLNRTASNGEANDISAGGLRLLCRESLFVGSELELRFTLPSSVLDVYPQGGERLEITPFGRRLIRIPDNRRPFEEMILRGRVLSRFQPQSGRQVYGIRFTDIDGYQREEIARFTHAAQLSKIRNAG